MKSNAFSLQEHGFDQKIVTEINARLECLINNNQVSIPLAVESGSRAWGFPSPDSDYDCRFVFIRRREAYLSLFSTRDVIETPLTYILDVNGWDIAKAIRLMLNGNAVIIEWLTSPYVYRQDSLFQSDFLSLATNIVDRKRVARHYLGLATNQIAMLFGKGEDVKLKKLFYVLRPVMALRWLRQNGSSAVAPMNFQSLCRDVELPKAVTDEISILIAKKAIMSEMGHGPIPLQIKIFLNDEIDLAKKTFESAGSPSARQKLEADAFFRRCIEKYG